MSLSLFKYCSDGRAPSHSSPGILICHRRCQPSFEIGTFGTLCYFPGRRHSDPTLQHKALRCAVCISSRACARCCRIAAHALLCRYRRATEKRTTCSFPCVGRFSFWAVPVGIPVQIGSLGVEEVEAGRSNVIKKSGRDAHLFYEGGVFTILPASLLSK